MDKIVLRKWMKKVPFIQSNIAVKTEANEDLQHDWEETVAEPTLLPATLFYLEAACLNTQADAAWLPMQQKRQKSWQINRNRRQPLMNPPKSLKTELRGSLGSC